MMDKKYNSAAAESTTAAQWEQAQTYSAENNPGPAYSIDTPPPTVSGSLHIGHIFSYTQTDIVARYKRMSGYSVFYPFGFDDNGLPTERYVEKKCDVRAHELGRSAFIKLCLEQTQEAEIEFKTLWQRMGLSVDWNYWYSTISERTRRIAQLSFIKLYNDGYIYQENEPALYCTACRTSVAQAELDDKEKPSMFNDIVFHDEQGNQLVVSTTRPELLSSTVALAVHPDDARFTHLHNKKAIVPLYNREVPIVVDDMVDPQKGTGLVMISTFGDQKDVLWFKKLKLPLLLSIGRDGKWLPHTGFLAGMKATEARAKTLEELQKNNLLLKQVPISHTVNVHERCKNEIEYSVLPQWFVNILDHKEHFIKIADEITWYPSFMKSRYVNWVENIKWNWCISRQRSFGIPFPVWHCADCKHIMLADPKDLPIDPQETAYPEKNCLKCKSSNIVPDTDVMDTWNTSSLTPYICYDLAENPEDPFDAKALEFLPMGMRPQAHDIIRTWAFYTIIKAWMHNKTMPWKDIVISGHVLSDQKEKLSKSKDNNRLAPNTLIDTYSADVIRFWTASGSLGQDIMFSEQQLKIGQRLVTKLWNAFLFIEQHIQNAPHDRPENLGLVNEWILDSATRTFAQYQKSFESCEFGLALTHLEPFFWNDVCDNYLELIKNQLFNPDQYDAQTVAATRWTLYQLGLRLLQFYAPYLPYVTETIYQALYKKNLGIDSIHQTRFAAVHESLLHDASRHTMGYIITIIGTARKLKTEHQLSLKAPITTLTISSADQAVLDSVKAHEQIIQGITHAARIEYARDITNPSSLLKVDDTTYNANIIL